LPLSMEQWELYKPSATEQEVHQTCPLLSWSTLRATLAPPSLTALCPSFLFDAARPLRRPVLTSPAAPQAGMGSHYPQAPGYHPEQGSHQCWQEGILPGLTFVACSPVRQLQGCAHAPKVCVSACWFGCGWIWVWVHVTYYQILIP